MNFDISAIIVNYNAGEFLRRCVDSLLSSPLKIEIIIVDNASSDKSLELLSELATIHIIKNRNNLGFAAACNQGFNQSTAPILLFLNPDCTFNPGALNRLLAIMQKDSRVGMVGGLLVNSDGTEQAGGRRAIPTPWRSFVRAFGLVRFAHRWPGLFYDFHLHKQPLPEHPIEVEAISGACMMVRRDVMQDVGEWDEGYFLHCEDLDWCMRFRKKGWKILFVPNAKITHASGVCSKDRKIFVEWHKHKGMIRFYRKFFKPQYPGALMGLVVVGVWLRFGMVATYHSTKQVRRAIHFKRRQRLQKVCIPPVERTSHARKVRSASEKRAYRIPRSTVSTPSGQFCVSPDKNQQCVGVLGATSFVGACLLQCLANDTQLVRAFSRREVLPKSGNIQWQRLTADISPNNTDSVENKIPFWVCLAPIATLPPHFTLLEAYGVKRIVVLSSTSRYTKNNSSDPIEQLLALRLAEAEARVQAWAESRGIEWIILRPTLIYGLGRDKNISEIARFIRRFGLFPLFNKAAGLRQPIHAEDVANACLLALQTPVSANRAYNISGAEIITYREMVTRVFSAMGKRTRLLSIPLWLFSAAVNLLRCLPRYRKWSSAMVERMNRDMVFDYTDAERDFGFKPRSFKLTSEDIPL